MSNSVKKDQFGNTLETPVPLWILAPYEDKKFWEMGKCTSEHQLLFSWYCAEQKRELLDCVAYWGSHDQYNKLREIYIEKKRQELIKEGKI